VSRNRCEQDVAVQPESQVGRNHMANEASSPHLAIHHKVKPGAGTSAGSQKGRCPSSGDQQDRLRLPRTAIFTCIVTGYWPKSGCRQQLPCPLMARLCENSDAVLESRICISISEPQNPAALPTSDVRPQQKPRRLAARKAAYWEKPPLPSVAIFLSRPGLAIRFGRNNSYSGKLMVPSGM